MTDNCHAGHRLNGSTDEVRHAFLQLGDPHTVFDFSLDCSE